MKLLLHSCYFTLFSSPPLPPTLWSFIPLLASLVFFLSALSQPYLHTQRGFDMFLLLFLFATFFLCFFYSFSHLQCPWFNAPQPRLREEWDEQVRCGETITTGCIWKRDPSQRSITVPWTVCMCVLTMCVFVALRACRFVCLELWLPLR